MSSPLLDHLQVPAPPPGKRTGTQTVTAPRPASRRPWFQRRPYRITLLFLPLALYLAALNPFFLPGTYDDVLYYCGAVSLAEEGSFMFRGKHIADWPPGTSALLAVPFALGLQSVWTAKVCILVCVALGMFSAFRLFERERRPLPLLTMVLFALLPCSFMMGTRVMSEWPYFLASILFLLALDKLRKKDGSDCAAVGVGLLLGAAALTKFTGVLLGAAIVAQMIRKWRNSEGRRTWRAILPEVTAASIGAGLFLIWKLKVHWQVQSGIASDYDYYRAGWLPVFLGWPDLLSVPTRITDLLFHSEAAVRLFDDTGWATRLACLIPGLLVLFGMLIRFRSGKSRPSDWYVLSLLAAFSLFEGNRQTRYLFSIAPFLIGYGIIGCQWIARGFSARMQDVSGVCIWIPRPTRIAFPAQIRNDTEPGAKTRGASLSRRLWPGLLVPRLGRTLVGGWMLLLIAAASYLLFGGNLNGTHRGMCFLVSRTPETFLRGSWLDLYQACQHINRAGPGKVAILGNENKYVTAFLDRPWTHFDSARDFTFLLALDRELLCEELDELKLEVVKRQGSVALYQRRFGQPSRNTDQTPSP